MPLTINLFEFSIRFPASFTISLTVKKKFPDSFFWPWEKLILQTFSLTEEMSLIILWCRIWEWNNAIH